MIGLDTNILVRFITQDDAAQAAKATKLFTSFSREKPGYISNVCILELIWVLQNANYRITKIEIVDILKKLLEMKEVVLERSEIVTKALTMFEKEKISFADCLIACCAFHAKCEATYTFDQRAAKVTGMKLLE